MSRHVYFVPHLLKITFISPPVYFTSSVLCIPFQVTFTSDHVYFGSCLLCVTFIATPFTLHPFHFTSRLLRIFLPRNTFIFHHVHFSSRLLGFTFLFPPFCFASRSLRAPFACLHVHVLPLLFSVTFILLLVSSPHVLFCPRLPLLRSPHVPFS